MQKVDFNCALKTFRMKKRTILGQNEMICGKSNYKSVNLSVEPILIS